MTVCALAMVGVLYVYYYNDDPTTEGLRVSLFFTVSGFLITHILYSAKELGGRISILNFYIRRALRLFPALFALVLVSAYFDIDGFRDEAMWHLLQLSNVRFAMIEKFHPWVMSHLWSLNMLEQFYLSWPIVIILLPIQRIYLLTLGIVVVTTLLRIHQVELGLNGWWTVLVFSSGPIAFGAFAYLLQRHEPIAVVIRSFGALALSAAVILSPAFMWEGFGQSTTYWVLCMPALSTIVVGAYFGYCGPVGWLLGCSLARFVSKISAVFIYHFLVWWCIGEMFPSMYEKTVTNFLVLSTVTGVVATLSWYLIEGPIGRLKSRFPIRQAPMSEADLRTLRQPQPHAR